MSFDWRYYVNAYDDLRKAGITTEEKAIRHYEMHGKYEGRRTHLVIASKEHLIPIPFETMIAIAPQCHVSSALRMFRERLQCKYPQLKDYYDDTLPCLFFGIYTDADLTIIKNHVGLCIIMPGGDDVNPKQSHSLHTLTEIKNKNNAQFLSISKCLHQRLHLYQIPSIYVTFNLVDPTLFRPVPPEDCGDSIFIFNGQTKGRERIYGMRTYTAVMRRLPQYNFILSNILNIKHEEMPGIYRKCFIMLRLTSADGNANSVQECEAMEIPVVHNQSEYGFKWSSVDDVVNHINRASRLCGRRA